MKVDGGLSTDSDFDGLMDKAREQEDMGYDGLWVPETKHDPFTMLPLLAHATERVELGTSIVVGFARNPMTLATSANDIQLISKGRFILGLGSQIKPHITKRFSMPWSQPAARMREMILACKAIWNTWNTGEKLDFRGDFYQHPS
jgi:probable F420-dependent oxidoreductase